MYKRTDDNQTKVVSALRKCGFSVAITSSLGDGFGDILVGARGKNFLIELKNDKKPPSKRKLTKDENKFKDSWTGQYDVCKNLDEILKVINES